MYLRDWADEPRTLPELLAWQSVQAGDSARDVEWQGAKREPFLTFEKKEDARKRELIVRLTEATVTIHFWEWPSGKRDYLKVKTT